LLGWDIISDCHGCYTELCQLFEELGYLRDGLSFEPPTGRIAVFVGDLVSRGPNSLAVIFLVRDMINKRYAMSVLGNHDSKIARWSKGNPVMLTHGDDGTAREIENSTTITKEEVVDFFSSLPLFLKLDDEKLVVVHACFKDHLLKESGFSKRCRDTCLFGPSAGMDKDLGIPNRIEWVNKRICDSNSPLIVYGHEPRLEARLENKTAGIDTGCVFGNKLTALRYPEMELVQVPALKSYHGKVGEWKPQEP
jgi:diadenosine tetraphosphatase ApaH/serine/threonine PP2A family protein phosphatase